MERCGSFFSILQREAANGSIEVIYEVKERVKKKKIKYLLPLLDKVALEQAKASLVVTAEKQRKIIDFFIEKHEPVQLREILSYFNVSTSTVKSLIKKGFCKKRKWKCIGIRSKIAYLQKRSLFL